MSWLWVVGGLVVWLVVSALLAVVVGRGISLADRRSHGTGAPLTTADLPPAFVPQRVDAPLSRRAVPLPPIGVGLAATAVALETSGYVSRLNGGSGTVAQLFSMDAPYSLPRMFVAGLFAVTALLAAAAAGRIPGRRTWWAGVALVAAGIALVKAGGTVHRDALDPLTRIIGTRGALAVSLLAAGVVVGALWFLSRHERRDRRRVLGTLVGYAAASVGLSAVSAVAPAGWAVTATFVEEAGEALAGVAFLVAVLVGVAPRVALPGTWALRRTADAQSLDVPEPVPGRAAESR